MKNHEIHTKNIEKINARYPTMIEYIKTNEKKVEDLTVEVNKAKNGQISFIINRERNVIHLHSKFDPSKDAKRWISNLTLSNDKIYIIYGLGMIYHIKELMNRIGNETKILIIEPSISIFNEIIKNIDITNIIENNNILIMIEDNLDKLRYFLNKNISWNNCHLVEYYTFSNYKKLFSDMEQKVNKMIYDHLYIRKIDRNTMIKFNRDWQQNLLKNMSAAVESNFISQLKDVFLNKPVIIVSAGPSLNKNVELLRNIKNKAVIICVDTALKVLLSKNINPDFIVTVDGGELNLAHFDNLDYENIPLIYMSISHPKILENHKGIKVLTDNMGGYIKELFKEFDKEVGVINLGGSVACVAFNIAIKLGADPIIFIGQDLAYTNNKTHAEGTKYARKSDSIKTKYFEVENIYGDKVLTGYDLYTFLRWFENEILNDTSNRLYIDATEGGAKIEGTEIMTFQDAINKYCYKDIEVTRKIHEALNSDIKFNLDELKLLIKKLQNMYNNLEIIHKKSMDAIKICNKIINIYKENKNSDNIGPKLNRLDNIDKYIKQKQEEFNMINHLIKPIVYKVFLENTVSNTSKDDISIMKRSLEFYTALSNSVEFTLPILKETITEIENKYN